VYFVGVVLCNYILQYSVFCWCCLMYLRITVLCILLVLSYVIVYYSIVYFVGVVLCVYVLQFCVFCWCCLM